MSPQDDEDDGAEYEREEGWAQPEPPKPTASELIEADVARALRVLRSTISVAAANAHTAIARGMPDGVIFSSVFIRSSLRTYRSASGEVEVVAGRSHRSLELRCSPAFALPFAYSRGKVVSLERLGASGDWILASAHRLSKGVCELTFQELS